MPIDFTCIDPEDFELLCEDLLQAMGFTIEAKVARGPDRGKDIIATRTIPDPAGFAETHRYLVECKHYAISGRSVPEAAIGSPIARMGDHNCDRYILATSTVPTEKVRAQLVGISNAVFHYRATIWSKGDLTRLLDEHPGVRERYFLTESKPSAPASQLADTVEALLAVKGFVRQSREAADERVRLVCTSKEAFARSAAVVCKEGAIHKPDVDALLAEVKDQALSAGALVTHKIITPAARDRAAQTDGLVQAFTLDAFYREIIDFEPYVRQLVAHYDGSDLATYYVDLGCRTADGSEIKPMDDYVDAWLDDPARNHISILGDYGTGKTSFCRQYAAKLGRRWLADPDRNRIPILISLHYYAKTVSLQQLITDFLVNRYGIQASYEAFTRFNADGKLALLFDGFDEMAQKVDYQTTVDNFEELARAVEQQSKVILTCRTPYFRTRQEAEELLWGRTSEVPATPEVSGHFPERPLIHLTDRPSFEIVHLLPFDDGDIQAILRKRFPAEWEEYWHEIQETYNLTELAQRPVLLDMIACSLPELEFSQVVNAAKLYEAYTDLWLTRDWDKGRHLITQHDKRLFMQALALEMPRRDELSIHYSKLPEQVQEHFHLEKATELDYFEHDIRTCSFLNRDPTGNYRFVHKSFQEFFVAQWLAPKLSNRTAPAMRINEEIRGFVHGLLADANWPSPPPEGVEIPEGMVWVPPGPFIRGGQPDLGDGPARVVRLDYGFFIARTLVTNSEFACFVEATGHVTTAEKEGKPSVEAHAYVKGFDWRHPEGPESCIADRMDHPVVYVSWHDATAYADWAEARLPTQQEWEKAARGIDGRNFPWGDSFDPARCNAPESPTGATTPVGRYSPSGDSPCGCADMVGNVWEWTASKLENSGFRVLRGGAFDWGAPFATCTSLIWFDSFSRYWYRGFRVVASTVKVQQPRLTSSHTPDRAIGQAKR
jgi:formylglycine-generating enzyme required for sulfatase activity